MPGLGIPAAVPVLPPTGPPVGGTDADRLRRACQDFESLFIYKLLEQMRATVPETSYLHSAQDDVYNAICDQQVAVALARSRGIGLAELLYRQLDPAKGRAASAYEAQGPADGPARARR